MIKKIILSLGLIALSFSSLNAGTGTAATGTGTAATGTETVATLPIISEKALKKAAQVTIAYSISEGKKKNSSGDVSW